MQGFHIAAHNASGMAHCSKDGWAIFAQIADANM
jgi:hypothetical protein